MAKALDKKVCPHCGEPTMKMIPGTGVKGYHSCLGHKRQLIRLTAKCTSCNFRGHWNVTDWCKSVVIPKHRLVTPE